MTDELKQEAEEKYFNHKMADFQGFYNYHYYCLGYLESAESREKRIAELEKENAELKEQCLILADCNTCHSTCKNENVEMKKQLTKAKELIKKLVHEFYYLCELHNFATDYECLAEAGRFLNSEVEK